MPGTIYDTSIWIAYKPTKLPNDLVMSAVVLQELAAGAADGTILKKLAASRIMYEKEDKLLVPTGEDWFMIVLGSGFSLGARCAMIINAMPRCEDLGRCSIRAH
ncbi:MAG TPA: hypothetical protein VJH03_20150 [Blastocatellia bacterium]|nr:hypothetical protein [Blastocatellia bacterium]